jgi:hypothetical protein
MFFVYVVLISILQKLEGGGTLKSGTPNNSAHPTPKQVSLAKK